MNWLHYLLEANLYLAVFYTGYYLFLSRETHYTLNRVYLLFGTVVSFVLPVLQLGMLRPVVHPVAAVHFTYPIQVAFVPAQVAATAPAFTLQDALLYGYVIGAGVLFLVLLVRLYQLLRLTASRSKAANSKYKIVYLNQSDTAFSFFNYLFIGTNVEQAEMIIRHELVHIRQKHSADVIFIEVLKIINWFNPFIYLIQYSLRAIHEYIADEQTATEGTDTITYSSFLVNNAYGLGGSAITHSFFNYNLLKKRIIMLHQKRSGNLARLKYLLAIPICGGLLCASTLAFSKTYGWVDIAPHHAIYVGADAVPQTHVVKDTDKSHLPPPPPPAPPKKPKKVKPPVIKRDTKGPVTPPTIVPDPKKPAVVVPDVKTPPPPPAPPTAYTKKGYKYQEDGYLINGKTDFRVIIYEKNGNQVAFFKSQSSAADINLLKNKYGYVFPVMDIHSKMPPPPPVAPTKTGMVVPKDKDKTKATALAIDTNIFKRLELIPITFKKGKGC